MSGLKALRKRAWQYYGNVDLANLLGVDTQEIQQFAVHHAQFSDDQLVKMARFVGYGGYDPTTDTLK